ncbi:MAG: RNA methyltransferase [Candidatus Sumerlaeia bacterium]
MILERYGVAVVLVSPKEEGNVGAAARAMANMGARRLVLVAPRCDLGRRARERAREGAGILGQALILPDMTAVASRFQTLVAMTARGGRSRGPIMTPREAAPLLLGGKGVDDPAGGPALVFGPEEGGLDNNALQFCHHVVRIPTEPASSLNLSHAVCVMLYDLRCWLLERVAAGDGVRDEPVSATAPGADPSSPDAPASNAGVEDLIGELKDVGRRIDHLLEHNEAERLWRYRRLFHRARLTNADLWMLRGLLRQVRWAAKLEPKQDRSENKPGSEGDSLL